MKAKEADILSIFNNKKIQYNLIYIFQIYVK